MPPTAPLRPSGGAGGPMWDVVSRGGVGDAVVRSVPAREAHLAHGVTEAERVEPLRGHVAVVTFALIHSTPTPGIVPLAV